MRALLSILAGGAAIALVLFALGVFDKAPAGQEPDEPAPTSDPKTTAPDGPGALLGGERAPTDEPELLIRPFEAPVGVLLLSERPATWSLFLQAAIEDSPNARLASWYTESLDSLKPNAGPGPGRHRGIEELTAQPTAEDLGRLDIDIVILDAIDPNTLPTAFWDEVARRVSKQDMGLWIRPGFPTGVEGQSKSAHAVFSHPALSKLLPVAEGEQLEGTPVPGTFPGGTKLLLSDAGARHPATQLSPYPKWARFFWEQRTDGEYAWKPAFCYPVKKLAPGAVSLVDAEVTSIERTPAIVISSQDVGRVLWQGNFDFGHKAYYSSTSTRPVGILVNRILLWLSGRS